MIFVLTWTVFVYWALILKLRWLFFSYRTQFFVLKQLWSKPRGFWVKMSVVSRKVFITQITETLGSDDANFGSTKNGLCLQALRILCRLIVNARRVQDQEHACCVYSGRFCPLLCLHLVWLQMGWGRWVGIWVQSYTHGCKQIFVSACQNCTQIQLLFSHLQVEQHLPPPHFTHRFRFHNLKLYADKLLL